MDEELTKEDITNAERIYGFDSETGRYTEYIVGLYYSVDEKRMKKLDPLNVAKARKIAINQITGKDNTNEK